MRYGVIVYALGIPAIAVSILLLLGGKTWLLWLDGFIYFVWAAYGYWVDYVAQAQFRNRFGPSIAFPYVLLYLAKLMFYWWPFALIRRPLWYVHAVLFIISTILNVTSQQTEETCLVMTLIE